VTIFLGGFKQFNSILTKITIQKGSSSDISKDCQSNHGKPKFKRSLKYFKIHPSQPRSIKNFRGGSVGCPKITKDKSSDVTSLQCEGRILNWNTDLALREAWRLQTRAWVSPRSMWVWGYSATNANLSNSAFHVKCGSEQLGAPLQTWVWGTLLLTLRAGLSNLALYEQLCVLRFPCLQQVTRCPRPARDPYFCCNRLSLLSQLTPHVMGELIPIMEGF